MHATVKSPTSARGRRSLQTALGASVAALSLLALAGCASSTSDATAPAAEGGAVDRSAQSPFDLSSANAEGRIRIDPVPEAVAAFEASGFAPIQDGKLTVATSAGGTPPLSFLAEDDNKTILGVEPDIAQLVADGLGLEFAPENVAWADWPLGVESGKYDVVISNVTVTEERKDIFDFAIHRNDIVSFSVKADSEIDRIEKPEDVSGLKVYVGSGTNQEKILLDWFAENEKNGLPPGEPIYFEDSAAAFLALSSGRVDVAFGPNPTAQYNAKTTGESKVVGQVNGGFPETAQIGVTTAKGNGLIEAVSIVLNHAIESGDYAKVLERWDLSDEAVEEALINPPGLPRP